MQGSEGEERRALPHCLSSLTLEGAVPCRQWEGPVRLGLHLSLPLCAVCVVVFGMLDVVLLRLARLHGLDPAGKTCIFVYHKKINRNKVLGEGSQMLISLRCSLLLDVLLDVVRMAELGAGPDRELHLGHAPGRVAGGEGV